MPAPGRTPPSPDHHPSKRARQSSPERDSPTSPRFTGETSPTGVGSGDHISDGNHGGSHASGTAGGKVGQSSNFRNVSACNRCRLRKNRCDQKLPSCASCEKAGVACVGYDPITKREIPRSYMFYLEKRVEQLEALLRVNNISFPASENLDYCSKSGPGSVRSPTETGQSTISEGTDVGAGGGRIESNDEESTGRPQKMVAKGSNPRHLGSATGISFARVVFAAVQSSVSDQRSNSDKGGIRPYKPASAAGNCLPGTGPATSMRDSFFGLHTKPTIHPATFPSKELGLKLVNLYFEHANPQMPVLHRVEFMSMFEQAYAEEGRVRGPRELYVLNMVFAIGAGIILAESKGDSSHAQSNMSSPGSRQCQPEEYHASAIVHLEACLSSGGGLEELQAVLLLANFALLRPVPPGLWYIIGVAVRLAVDLGLHYEDKKDIQAGLSEHPQQIKENLAKERGRREYVRDMRRRLWWCTYSFDRLVSVCVGRPFGISDLDITTEFPSLLEDRYITQNGFHEPPPNMRRPTYKLVARHYFRLRLLQSEISQVLHFQQAQIAKANEQNQRDPLMHTQLPSPFLSKFDSFRSWRINIDKRLWEWKNTAPKKEDTGVAFLTDFLDLNYWQAIIMLYRQSLSVPAMFEGEYHTAKEVDSPTVFSAELREDEDRVYLKVAEAGQKILRLYRQLHLAGLVNYTYLTTHHLFVAGISYLYAIWHSPIVRSRLSMDEVDFTILAATSVFTDLMDKCPPAEACRDAFDRTVKATIKMVNASGGFGQQYQATHPRDNTRDWASSARSDSASVASSSNHQRPHAPHRAKSSMDYMASGASPEQYANSAAASAGSIYRQHSSHHGGQFRLSGIPSLKNESAGRERDVFSLMRNIPALPRSNAGGAENPLTPDETATIDQQILAAAVAAAAAAGSPVGGLANSPVGVAGSPIGPPSASALYEGLGAGIGGGGGGVGERGGGTGNTLSFNDLQEVDFLQGMGGSDAGGEGGFGGAGAAGGTIDTPMDMGFGLGWDMHHDYSDGQQLDLFDGFFFGGQQGGGAAGGGLGGGGSVL
ncbi:positive regulator of purine utilization [Cladorrhinum samala]|uniref:Positive regulator of purine utilization n=1 Tax=Cladorrhinum samala TaxID=585594 RepID=A0AAV9HW04_9PEZI|nr:positive regulator of purine utilization [Cladorrhinum samala]